MSPKCPKFVFMLLKEHPYGREMLMQCIAAGHIPCLIVQEDSKIASEEREKFLVRIADHAIAPTIDEQATRHGINVIDVPQHNKEESIAALTEAKPELLVLGGTRIIREPVLQIPPLGTLNAHPGLLPECRGSASPAWSVYHDIPIGSTCHFCEPGVDTGDIVGRRQIKVTHGMRYEDLCYHTLVLSGTLMAEALSEIVADTLTRTKQGESEHPTFRCAPDDVLEVVHQKLKEGTYKHFSK